MLVEKEVEVLFLLTLVSLEIMAEIVPLVESSFLCNCGVSGGKGQDFAIK